MTEPDVDQTHTLHCTEVWGGNWRVDQAVALPGLDAWVYSEPCDHAAAGGDVHYVSACAAGQVVRALVADVSGHGETAAATADALRRLMRRLVNDHDQRRLVRHLNREFAAAARDADPAEFRFATAVALTFDSGTRRLLACNAGHPPPLWYRAADRRWTTLEPAAPGSADNVPVGVVAGFLFEQFEVALGVGDLVLCHTDPLIEARDRHGQDLGTAGLLECVRAVDADGRLSADPARLVPAVLAALAGMDPLNLTRDDLTCLLLRADGSRPAVPLVDRLLSPARAAAGLVGVHLPWTPRRPG